MADALERAREAAKHSEDARDEFEQAIRAAAKEHSLREVGKAVGLTHSRVHQIVHERKT